MSGRTILVTGGCGYIGAQLIRELASSHGRDWSIRVFDNMQRGRYEALMDLPGNGRVQFVEGDILDAAAVRMALQGVDTVLHLAAMVRTPMSFDHPIWVEQINHWGTSRLVELCIETGVKRFIYASSASVYGPGESFTEESVARPLGPYAQSKFKGEQSVMAARERGLEAVILRLGTVYGLGAATRFDAVVNRLAFLAGVHRPVTVFGGGEQRRPFVHVLDACRALSHFLDAKGPTPHGVYNAVAENISVNEIVSALRQLVPALRVHYTEQDVLTHQSFVVDSSRLKAAGWAPSWDIQQGLEQIVHHFNGLAAMPSPCADMDID